GMKLYLDLHDRVLRRLAATQDIPFGPDAGPNDLLKNGKLTGSQPLIPSFGGAEHGALVQGLHLLVERHRGPWRALVRHLVEQRSDLLRIELLLGLILLALLLLVLLFLELGQLLALLLIALFLGFGLLALLLLIEALLLFGLPLLLGP